MGKAWVVFKREYLQGVRKKMLEASKEVEQWARLNRRFHMLPQDVFLPSEMETNSPEEEMGKLKVRFYLDTSASCWHRCC